MQEPVAVSDNRITSPLDLIVRLAPYTRLLVWGSFATAVLFYLISYALPVTYRTSITILPVRGQSGAAGVAAQLSALNNLAGLNLGGGGRSSETDILAILESNRFLDSVVLKNSLTTRYGVPSRIAARGRLQRNVRHTTNANTGVIDIEVSGRNAMETATIANSIPGIIRASMRSIAVDAANQRREFFTSRVEEAQKQLRVAEEALRRNPRFGSGAGMEKFMAFDRVAALGALQSEIAATEIQLDAQRSVLGPQHPDMRRLQDRLDALRAQAGRAERSQVQLTPEDSVLGSGYISALREVQYLESANTLLQQQLDVARLDEARDGSVVQVVDTADVPRIRSEPRRSLIALVAAIAFFIAALLGLVIRAYVQHYAVDPARGRQLESFARHVRRVMPWVRA